MIVVVGAGVAGTSAALTAARAGASVTLIDGGPGASSLWTGVTGPARDSSAEGRAVAVALDVTLGPTIVATTSAFARVAHGHDAAILNLYPWLRDKDEKACVGVVRCERPGWDADIIVRAARQASDASDMGPGFVAVDATVLRHSDERVLPDADFAARHDDEERLGWLADRLRDALQRAGGRPRALLLPPSLGVERARASELSRLVGVGCGEATGLPGGPAGLRFERARDRALATGGVAVVRGRAHAVSRVGARWRVTHDGGEVDADAVIVATGGLIGGGLEYQPSDAMLAAALPPVARVPFRCTLGGPFPIGAHGRPLDMPGTLFGIAPEALAWPLARDPLMDRVGVLCDPEGHVVHAADAHKALATLYAAGELVADAPRTWLQTLEAGARAGSGAARDVVRASPARPASLGGAPASRP